MQSFLVEMKSLFMKLFPRKLLNWELRRTYENLRLEYKMYIRIDDFDSFEKLEDLGKQFETEILKSKIRGQTLSMTVDRNKDKQVIQNDSDKKNNRNLELRESNNADNGRGNGRPFQNFNKNRYNGNSNQRLGNFYSRFGNFNNKNRNFYQNSNGKFNNPRPRITFPHEKIEESKNNNLNEEIIE